MIQDSPLGRIVVPDFVPPGRTLFYTTLDFPGRIDERLRAFVSKPLASCHQVHSTDVHRVAGLPGCWVAGEPKCDALFTSDPNVALAIKVADCLPVTIIGRDVIANIHSGWRGAAQRITDVTLDAIERATDFDAKSAYAYLGPAIRVCCFEVGEEVAAQFDAGFVSRGKAKPHVDIVALTVALLQRRGFRADRVIDTGLCTRCDNSIFHSFRRDGSAGGRNLAIVA